jgi:hypothetical protein
MRIPLYSPDHPLVLPVGQQDERTMSDHSVWLLCCVKSSRCTILLARLAASRMPMSLPDDKYS